MLEREDYSANETLARDKRQVRDFPGTQADKHTDTSKEDVCESRVEVSTPYWAQNSDGKVRAILNNKEFEQAVHQEICTGGVTLRCNRDCSCEQKYKWHRLLAYDPNNDCAGIFMDWFLFPSCCVCRSVLIFDQVPETNVLFTGATKIHFSANSRLPSEWLYCNFKTVRKLEKYLWIIFLFAISDTVSSLLLIPAFKLYIALRAAHLLART